MYIADNHSKEDWCEWVTSGIVILSCVVKLIVTQKASCSIGLLHPVISNVHQSRRSDKLTSEQVMHCEHAMRKPPQPRLTAVNESFFTSRQPTQCPRARYERHGASPSLSPSTRGLPPSHCGPCPNVDVCCMFAGKENSNDPKRPLHKFCCYNRKQSVDASPQASFL